MNKQAVKAMAFWLLISPLLGWIGSECINNDYMTYRPVTVETVRVYSGMSSGRYSSLDFIGVFKTKEGVLFDRRVSASLATWLKEGELVTLELRPMDIQQTNKDNLIYFFLAAVLIGPLCYITIAVWGGTLIWEYIKDKKN